MRRDESRRWSEKQVMKCKLMAEIYQRIILYHFGHSKAKIFSPNAKQISSLQFTVHQSQSDPFFSVLRHRARNHCHCQRQVPDKEELSLISKRNSLPKASSQHPISLGPNAHLINQDLATKSRKKNPSCHSNMGWGCSQTIPSLRLFLGKQDSFAVIPQCFSL